MDLEQALTTLRRHSADIRSLGASHLFLFGSVAKNQARPDSDVDLFFDFEAPDFSIVELVAISERISALLEHPADVISRGSIHPRLRASIETSAIQVF